MINRPDRPIARDGDDRDRQAILRERGEGAHAEQDALTDPDAVAGAFPHNAAGGHPTLAAPSGDRVGPTTPPQPNPPVSTPAYDVTDPDELRDAEAQHPEGLVDVIDVTEPDDIRDVAEPDQIRDVADPDGDRIVPVSDEDHTTGH